jgi:hypothetical protein
MVKDASQEGATADELKQLFAFEADFGDRLVCLPMAVRYKLDTVGIKLHLKEWVGLSEEQRREFLFWPLACPADATAFAARVSDVVKARGRAPDTFLAAAAPEWLDSEQVPEAVRARGVALGLTVSAEHWRRFSPLRRFALIKLSRPKHDAEKLRPALKEFGVV